MRESHPELAVRRRLALRKEIAFTVEPPLCVGAGLEPGATCGWRTPDQ